MTDPTLRKPIHNYPFKSIPSVKSKFYSLQYGKWFQVSNPHCPKVEKSLIVKLRSPFDIHTRKPEAKVVIPPLHSQEALFDPPIILIHLIT